MTGGLLLEKLCREDFFADACDFFILRNRNVFLSFASHFAVVAQLVEHWLPKPRVTGSSPAYRSKSSKGVQMDSLALFGILMA